MNTNVMFTDIVGYSKLTGDDQHLALELLKEHDKIIEPIIIQYNGSIVKRIGDAIVAIFDDTTDINQASVEIQQALKNRNNSNTKSRQLVIRIGLHYGEVILKNNEVYGLGYELASSIEPISEFAGIAISQDLYDNAHDENELIVRGKKNHFFIRPIAHFSFKAISNKLIIYKLYLNLLDWYDEPQIKVAHYLKKQNIKTNIYDLKNIQASSRSTTNHYKSAINIDKKNNLSYALYHYKMHLDYGDINLKQKQDIELLILHIFSSIGLNRLVDRIYNQLIKLDAFKSSPYLAFIKGVNYFNIKNFSKAQVYFEESINAKNSLFFDEALNYLLVIFFKNKDYNKGLDLISYYKKDFASEKMSKFHFSIVFLIFEFNKNKTDELIKKIFDEHLSLSENKENTKSNLFIFWFLIQFYQNIKESKKSLEVQEVARLLINKLANQISGLQLKTLFKDKPILHQMLNEEIELNFISDNEDLDFIEIETKTNNIFKFCTECGFKNDKNFSFCPACGQKLTK